MNPATTALEQDKTWFPKDRWLQRHDDYLSTKPDSASTKVVFLGDSITEFWLQAGKPLWQNHFETYGSFNMGISGDETQHVLWRLENGALDALAPQAIVLLIGTNNLGNDPKHTPEQTADGIVCVVETILKQQPKAKLLVVEPLPRGKVADEPLRIAVKKTNELIRPRLASLPVRVLDLEQTFLEPDGTISDKVLPDFLHLSEEGYRRLATAIDGVLAAWVA